MSRVTTLMLSTAGEPGVVALLNDRLTGDVYFGEGFTENSAVAEAWGDMLPAGCALHAAAWNHGEPDQLVELVPQLPWAQPECVQLFVLDQDAPYFRVFMIRGDRMLDVVPNEALPVPFEPALAPRAGRRSPAAQHAGTPTPYADQLTLLASADAAAAEPAAAVVKDALGAASSASLGRLLIESGPDVVHVRLGIALLRAGSRDGADAQLAEHAARHPVMRAAADADTGTGARMGNFSLAEALSAAADGLTRQGADGVTQGVSLPYLDFLLGRLYDFARPIPIPLIDRYLTALESVRPVGSPWALDKVCRYLRDPSLDLDPWLRTDLVERCLMLGARAGE